MMLSLLLLISLFSKPTTQTTTTKECNPNKISCEVAAIHEKDVNIDLIKDIIDLDRYPIHETGESYDKLVEECVRQLAKVGSVDLEGFIREDVIEQMAAEVDDLPTYNRQSKE